MTEERSTARRMGVRILDYRLSIYVAILLILVTLDAPIIVQGNRVYGSLMGGEFVPRPDSHGTHQV